MSGTPDGVEMISEAYEVTGLPGLDLQDCIDQQDAWTGARDCVRLDTVTGVAAR